MADLPHGFSQVADPLDVYATFVAEACIETANDEGSLDEIIEDARSHIWPHLDYYSNDLQTDIETKIEEIVRKRADDYKV